MSRAIAKLDEGLKVWREPPLGEAPYLFLDARYEKPGSKTVSYRCLDRRRDRGLGPTSRAGL